jgi:sigma-54-interacting transcriptional regulator
VKGPVEVVLSEADTLRLVSTREWRSVCKRHHPMLLEGPEEVTETVLSLLKPHLRTPVVWTCSQSLREFPAASSGALVLRDVAALGRQEQTRLFRWLDDPHGPKQVVSTTARPLFASVARGHFDEALYYRLNVIRLSVALKAMAPIPRSAIESSAGAVWNTDLR